MTKAIRIYEIGGPEVLKWEDVAVGEPGAGEVRLKHTAIGLNYIEVYQRTGLYKITDFPATIGSEAGGVIEAVGDDVTDFKVGDRVTYAMNIGAYSEART